MFLLEKDNASFEESSDEQTAIDFDNGIRAEYNLPRRYEALAPVHTQEVRCIIILEYASFC